MKLWHVAVAVIFQSTLPVWGATDFRKPVELFRAISIHAPRVGSDGTSCGRMILATDFNPRSPCGERLIGVGISVFPEMISIHAPCVGSDFFKER